MKPISSHFFAALFCWNEIFGFKAATAPRCAESLNVRLPRRRRICRLRPPEGWIFAYSRSILKHKCHFNEPGLYFDACFHLNTHISSPLAQRAAEAASRSKIWLYHQVSIPAGLLRCLILILQTGVGGLKLLLQWISPPLFLFVRKTSVLRSAVSTCLSVPSAACLCCVEAWILGFHKRFIHLELALKPFITALYVWYIC